ncbi:hypothetical protein K8Z61_07235 [Nocardioides sp. TRM66260-LWL]|uniref:hypothetical protein n=1 Tax=Nocardioides sp. TRM66260-LWL TaxID=2874478 RepID=UPI001CC3B6E7|nr:hypothetical protein [Nocardioides sp. TRM66260-LWL]MBZ5734285.1 hypothetical protein [Nocardioides sp. TRM66260-LWL]
MSPAPPDGDRPGVPGAALPGPLRLALGLVVLEVAALVALAALQLASFSGDRATLGVTTAVFFLLFAGVLGLAARALAHRQTWARGPVLLAQLIVIGLAWNFRADVGVALVLLVVGAACLGAMVQPATLAFLEDSPPDA